jgi:hypothetical protein
MRNGKMSLTMPWQEKKIMQRNSPLPYTKKIIGNILTKIFNQFKNES